eukprot:TRINITY_DN3735_c0_g1_i4.p1 TRINITY_DN3735_c0_g1~~TRINITY_DN3735_c0_g1_i4.p1  ORF type:complete len:229 (+),score=48.75 TRINITY_DN3735_c0_g1_i4:31-717(+)
MLSLSRVLDTTEGQDLCAQALENTFSLVSWVLQGVGKQQENFKEASFAIAESRRVGWLLMFCASLPEVFEKKKNGMEQISSALQTAYDASECFLWLSDRRVISLSSKIHHKLESVIVPWLWMFSNLSWFVTSIFMFLKRRKKASDSKKARHKRFVTLSQTVQYFCELQLSLKECFPRYLPFYIISLCGLTSALLGMEQILDERESENLKVLENSETSEMVKIDATRAF